MKKLSIYITRLFGLVVVIFGILTPAFAATASATSLQTIFVKQSSLSKFSCGSDPNQWGFVITTQGLTSSEIPPYISVEWSSTQPTFVPLYLSNAPVQGGSAHYFTDTSVNPESYAFDKPLNAEVNISTDWTGQFVLSHGACPSTTAPTLTITKTAGSTPINAGSNSSFIIASSANNLLSADQVTLTDPLPIALGVSYLLDSSSNKPSGSQVAWTSCAISPAQVLSCSYTAPNDGSFSFAKVIIDVSSSATAPTETLDNTATISADGIVETSYASILIKSAVPTLTIEKTVGIPGSVSQSIGAGQDSIFTLSDLGVVGWDYGKVALTDPLPSGSGVSYSLDAANNDPTAGQIAWDNCSLTSDTVACAYTPSPTGIFDPSFANVVVDVSTTSSASGETLNNTATIALATITAQASASLTVTGGPSPEAPSLSITKLATEPIINAPGSSTFTIDSSATIMNIEPESFGPLNSGGATPSSPSPQIVLFDPLPAAPGISYSLDLSSNVATGSQVTWTNCSLGLGNSVPSSGSTTFTAGTFSPSGAAAAVYCYFSYSASQQGPSTSYNFARVIVDVKADSTSPEQTVLNTASITAQGVSEYSSASILIHSATPTLTIIKTAGMPGSLASSVYAGQDSIFTMSSLGVTGWDYGKVTLTDPLPSGTGVSYALDPDNNSPTR